MSPENKDKKYKKTIEKEWKALKRREECVCRISMKEESETEIPEKVSVETAI